MTLFPYKDDILFHLNYVVFCQIETICEKISSEINLVDGIAGLSLVSLVLLLTRMATSSVESEDRPEPSSRTAKNMASTAAKI